MLNVKFAVKMEFTKFLLLFLGCMSLKPGRADVATFNAFDDDVLFNIDWKGPLLNEDIKKVLDNREKVAIRLSESEQYECFLPSKAQADKDEMSINQDYIGKSAKELLVQEFKSISILGCSYKIDGYWSYELCHGEKLRQFHSGNDENGKERTQQYILGFFDKTETRTDMSGLELGTALSRSQIPLTKIDNVEYPYFEFNITSGTTCDINGKARQGKIRYVCVEGGNLKINTLEEVSTCEYIVVVFSDALCRHPFYRPHVTPVHEIACYSNSLTSTVPKGMLKVWQSIKNIFGADNVVPPQIRELIGSEEHILEAVKYPKEVQLASLEGLVGDGPKTISVLADEEDDSVLIEVDVPGSNGNTETKIIVKKKGFASNLGKMDLMKQALPSSKSEKEKITNSILSAAGPISMDEFNAQPFVQDFINGKFCLYGGTGYWKIEFCYGKHVTQYHDDQGSRRSTVTLGNWSPAEHLEWIDIHPEKAPKQYTIPYEYHIIRQLYSSGDYCHDSGKTRTVEVVMKCRPWKAKQTLAATTVYVLEPSTCLYVLMVDSPFVCSLLEHIDTDGVFESDRSGQKASQIAVGDLPTVLIDESDEFTLDEMTEEIVNQKSLLDEFLVKEQHKDEMKMMQLRNDYEKEKKANLEALSNKIDSEVLRRNEILFVDNEAGRNKEKEEEERKKRNDMLQKHLKEKEELMGRNRDL